MNEIISIIENLNIPKPDISRKVIAQKKSNILSDRFIGMIYDEVFKQKIKSINAEKTYRLSYGRYRNENSKNYDYIITYDSIYKKIHKSFKWHIKRNKIKDFTIIDTANYLTELFNKVNFSKFKAKHKFIRLTKWGYPITVIDNFGKKRHGTSFEADMIIDDFIIDIKTYDSIKFSHTEFLQLLFYYAWTNHCKREFNLIVTRMDESNNDAPSTNYLGIFYSKHSYLWTFNISDLCSKNDFEILVSFILSNIEETNLDFPKEILSLFSFVRNKKFIYRNQKNESTTFNNIQKNKLHQIEELITLRYKTKSIKKKGELSNILIQTNKEYCYSNYRIKYNINSKFDYKSQFIGNIGEEGMPTKECILKYHKFFNDYTIVENKLMVKVEFYGKSIEDLIFYIKHINRLINRIELLNKLKANNIRDLLKNEIELFYLYYKESAYLNSEIEKIENNTNKETEKIKSNLQARLSKLKGLTILFKRKAISFKQYNDEIKKI